MWRGTATRLSDICNCFADDPKAAEIALLDRQVRFEVSQVSGFKGALVDAPKHSQLVRPPGRDGGVHLLIHDFDELRGALKPDSQGRSP